VQREGPLPSRWQAVGLSRLPCATSPRLVVESPSLEIFKTRLDKVLYSLL